jgi:chorismate synthase
MAGNSLGTLFRLTTFGESHGEAIGGILDGCPAGLTLDVQAIQHELDRRRPGQSHIVTQRKESDTVNILSGFFEGKTTGAPIGFVIYNEDQRSKDYNHNQDVFRPSHADFTWFEKYGIRDHRGGGRTSARETASRVVGGAIAKQVLAHYGISIQAFVKSVGDIVLEIPYSELDLSKTDENIVRCPHADTAERMITRIEEIRKQGDTIGGVIACVVKNCPIGLGEPAFDKLHAELGKAMLSINAAKGFEYGSGFEGTRLKGSEHNDPFRIENGKTITTSNHSGGVQGGISNGADIYFNTAFKPVATIMQEQETVNEAGEETTISGRGRHDPCVLPRAVPIVEAMTALVIADYLLISKTNRL